MDKLKDKLNTAKETVKKLKNSEKDLINILDIPKEFSQKLTDNNMPIVLSRKGNGGVTYIATYLQKNRSEDI